MTMAEVMEDGEGESCEGCGSAAGPSRPVSWSPAFGRHLCSACRARCTDAELGATERANAAARFADRSGAGASAP